MKKIGCLTFYLNEMFKEEDCIKPFAEAGFDSLDYSFNNHNHYYPNNSFWQKSVEEIIEYYSNIKSIINKAGLMVFQAHSPYPTYFEEESMKDWSLEVARKCIAACNAVGGRYLVIHPNVPVKCQNGLFMEETFKTNIAFFTELIPTARHYGVKIAIENMFNWDSVNKKPTATISSSAESMVEIIDTLNGIDSDNPDKVFVACLDTGHAMLSGGGDIPHMIHTLGSRLKIMHIHDNDGKQDLHQFPFTGVIDWQSVVCALDEIGYDGVYNLEVAINGKTVSDYLSGAYKAGKALISL